MYFYRQSIILFGVVIPIICAIAACSIGYIIRSKTNQSYENKSITYRTYKQANVATSMIEKQVIDKQVHLDRWLQLLSIETASVVQSYIRDISEKLPSKEIQQTSFERVSGKSDIGSSTAQPSSSVTIAYKGTYRTLQRAFFELETKLPQLQLQDFKLEPIQGSPSLLNFQVTYAAWEK